MKNLKQINIGQDTMNNQINIIKSLTKKIVEDKVNPKELARLLSTLLLEVVTENKIKDPMIYDVCKTIKGKVQPWVR